MSGVWGGFFPFFSKRKNQKKSEKREARLLCTSTSLGQGAEVSEGGTSTFGGGVVVGRRVFCVKDRERYELDYTYT